MIAEGEKVVSRLTVHGVHQGDFQGIPPTGKAVMQTGIDILRLAGGKVIERWGEFDNRSFPSLETTHVAYKRIQHHTAWCASRAIRV